MRNKIKKEIKLEYPNLYSDYKESKSVVRDSINVIKSLKWYWILLFFLFLGILNIIFSFDFSDTNLCFLNFIELSENGGYTHRFTLYVATFISVTIVVTTFLFNFLKEKVNDSLLFITREIYYAFTANYGFCLILFLLIQDILLPKIPIDRISNLIVLDFYLVISFLLLLLLLYSNIFFLINPINMKLRYETYIKQSIIESEYEKFFSQKKANISNNIENLVHREKNLDDSLLMNINKELKRKVVSDDDLEGTLDKMEIYFDKYYKFYK